MAGAQHQKQTLLPLQGQTISNILNRATQGKEAKYFSRDTAPTRTAPFEKR